MTRRAVGILVVLVMAAAGCSDDEEPAGSGDGPGTSGTDVPAALAITEGTDRSEPDSDAPVDALAAGLNDAGFDLLRTLPIEDNAVLSPSSIGHALLMARGAADQSTGAAIDAAFGLPEGLGAHQAWNAIDQQLTDADESEEDVTVNLADRIWPQLGLEPDQAWVDLLATEHGADVQPLDLQGDPGTSRRAINEWVAEQTEDLIPELLPEGFITPSTILVLTDAVYLAARWQTPFGKYGTEDATFTRLDGSTVDVELMRELELSDLRGAGDGFVGAEIPYAGGELSMLVIVPDEGRFADVRDRLDQSLLDEIDATFTTGPYELLLPQWEDRSDIDLMAWLTGLGAAPGSYPGISPDAFLGAAVHGADIAVDDQGTVAAAATALGFEESGPPEPEMAVRADRPFVYVIRHRPSGLVLFAGQVTDPTD
jgi:serpin B